MSKLGDEVLALLQNRVQGAVIDGADEAVRYLIEVREAVQQLVERFEDAVVQGGVCWGSVVQDDTGSRVHGQN